ncbi:hypothetical protein BX600DRAFT_456893 [Xylariales sp. PMI_506]|nr:hypothetical protein BX600DRAFT_456893 [Xylariales sp. PMI_506]
MAFTWMPVLVFCGVVCACPQSMVRCICVVTWHQLIPGTALIGTGTLLNLLEELVVDLQECKSPSAASSTIPGLIS